MFCYTQMWVISCFSDSHSFIDYLPSRIRRVNLSREYVFRSPSRSLEFSAFTRFTRMIKPIPCRPIQSIRVLTLPTVFVRRTRLIQAQPRENMPPMHMCKRHGEASSVAWIEWIMGGDEVHEWCQVDMRLFSLNVVGEGQGWPWNSEDFWPWSIWWYFEQETLFCISTKETFYNTPI